MANRQDGRRWFGRHLIWLGATAILSGSIVPACGGEVVYRDPDTDDADSSSDGTSGGSASGSGSTTDLKSQCIACSGHAACRYCLVHGYNQTYVCPPSKSPPRAGCLDLLENHETPDGQPFTCYYCN